MNSYTLGQKKALQRVGLTKHAGMILPPTLAGAALGGGLGAWQAGEGERLEGGATGALLGAAGGMAGGALGSGHGQKQLTKAMDDLVATKGWTDEASSVLKGKVTNSSPELQQLMNAAKRQPEYEALGATSGALAGAGLGAGAGRIMRDEHPPQQPPQLPAAYGM